MGLALDLEDYYPSVLLHCWLGHLTCKIVSETTYNVSSGTLNPTIPYVCWHSVCWQSFGPCFCEIVTDLFVLILYRQDMWTADSKVQEGVWCLSASFISSSMIPSPTKFLVSVTDRLLQLLARCLRGSCMLCVLLAARDCIELRRILIRCVEKVRDAVVDSLVGQDALSFISSLMLLWDR